MTTKLAMNLQYERTIAIPCLYILREKKVREREKISSFRKYIYIFSP
jgi:hypothetical protein